MTAMPFSDCDSICSTSLTSVVMPRSTLEVMRCSIFNGLQPQEMEQRITSNVERGNAALYVGGDALLHFLGLQAVVGPDETDDRNVDIGKNVDRGSEEHNRRQQNNHERHHDKRVWPRQR